MPQWILASLALVALLATGSASATGEPVSAEPGEATTSAETGEAQASAEPAASGAEPAPAPEPETVAGQPPATEGAAAEPAKPVPFPIPEEEPTDPEQQFLIGRALLLGHDEHGAPHKELRNAQAANDWFEKAARQGHVKAQVNLGISYMRGRGRYGPDKGLEWLRKASDQGHPKAHLELAIMYRDGRFVRRDRVRALMYIVLAAQRGSPAAQFMQSGFARRLKPNDRAEALRLVREWRTARGYPATGPLPPLAAISESSETAEGSAGEVAGDGPPAPRTPDAAGDPAGPAS